MSFLLQNKESLSPGIKRILHSELDWAISSLKDSDHREGVHEARKSFKKVRAVLRLVRDEAGKKNYRYENVWYRDAGRQLSALRDATALIETLEVLKTKYKDEVDKEIFNSIRKNLKNNRKKIEEDVLSNKDTLNRVTSLVEEGKERIQNLNINKESFKAVKKSIARVYRRGYRAMRRAIENPSIDNLHLWRKRVKYLWYMVLLLRNIWPTIMDAMAVELNQLSKLLGTDHDLAVFEEAIDDNVVSFPDTTAKIKMKSRISRYRNDLQNEIFLLGTKIYRTKPKAFVKNLEAYWKTWRRNMPTK